jgi:NADPH:quinone reductase
VERIRGLAADGVHHIVEVAFGANIKTDTEVLAQGGSISTYATNTPMPETPVWQLVFVNARLFFVGSDDVPAEAKIEATRDINKALEAGWQGLDIAEIVPVDERAISLILLIELTRLVDSKEGRGLGKLGKGQTHL